MRRAKNLSMRRALPAPRVARAVLSIPGMRHLSRKNENQLANARGEAVPVFRTLAPAECEALLMRNQVGRLAYMFERVDIEPIHYVFADDVLYARTSPGSKLTKLAHNPWVAFEVDEVDDLFEWRSVVVHGTVYVVEDGDVPQLHDTHALALARVRSLIPEAMSEGDPTPFRTVLFRIAIDTMTGRESRAHKPFTRR